MTRKRRTFSAEIKPEEARLVIDQGHLIPKASRSLSAGETVLRFWVQKLQGEKGGVTPKGQGTDA